MEVTGNYKLYKAEASEKYNRIAHNENMDIIDQNLKKISDSATGKMRIVCWGDSLTFGDGGNVSGWHVIDYPQELACLSGCSVVNMGVQGEDSVTIMARQGADPMVVPAITIPAGIAPVQLGTHTAGLSTVSGKKARPLHYGAAGINPCYIGGIKGNLTATNRSDTETMTYYFTRESAGNELNVAAGTQIETYAMKYLKGGIAVIWMGANGGWENTEGTRTMSILVDQLQSMIKYGLYDDYLILWLREAIDTPSLTLLSSSFETKFYHLLPDMATRGLMDANIINDSPTMVNGLPSELSGGDGLHLTFYGYKLVGNYVYKKLVQNGVLTGNNTASPEVIQKDEYGTLLYKLAATKILDGVSGIVNTGVKLYSTVTRNWTMVCVFDNNLKCTQGYPYNLVSCNYDGKQGLLVRRTSDEPLTVNAGTGGIRVDFAGCPEVSGKNVLIISKNNGNYGIYLNGELAYDQILGYAMEESAAHDLPLIAGARYSASGELQYFTAYILYDLRVYQEVLSSSEISLLTAELMA